MHNVYYQLHKSSLLRLLLLYYQGMNPHASLSAFLTLFIVGVSSWSAAQNMLDTDLVLRLFGSPYGSTLSRDTIFVNEVPPVLAREFPLPPRTRPAGGVAYDRFSALAVLDSQLTPAEVLTFYRRTFVRLHPAAQ